MAGALVTKDGKVFPATSAKGARPTYHPQVEAELKTIPPDPRMPGAHGRCVEPAAISDALTSGAKVEGSTVATAQVRAVGNPGHGQPIAPCAVCGELLRRFNAKPAI